MPWTHGFISLWALFGTETIVPIRRFADRQFSCTAESGAKEDPQNLMTANKTDRPVKFGRVHDNLNGHEGTNCRGRPHR